MLEEEAALLEEAEGSQVMGSKRKEIATGDKKVQRPSKKATGEIPWRCRSEDGGC